MDTWRHRPPRGSA